MKIYYTCFILFFLPLLLFTQKHDHIWLTGYSSFGVPEVGGTVIDFNDSPPFIYREDREMDINATVASFCDSLGNLLAYTNGLYIANMEGDMMENGDSLNPGPIAFTNSSYGYAVIQSAIFIQNPKKDNLIHLFHLKLDPHDSLGLAVTTLYQTTIDTQLDEGLGGVVEKNKEIITDEVMGTMSAVKHGNGRDWWIFVAQISQNKYFRLLLSENGLSEPEEISLMPAYPPDILSNGSIVFSPDGSRFARYEILHGIYIYDFDPCTGTFSNPTFIPKTDTNLGGGVAISPNSQFLYIASRNEIYQYDLWAIDIPDSEVLVAEYDGFLSPLATAFFWMQLGPDGRIYINTTNSNNVMHAIQYPNKKGLACEVRQHSVQLPTYNAFTMPHFPNYRLGPIDGSVCDTLGLDNRPLADFRFEVDTLQTLLVEFTDNSFYQPTDWFWDFGEGNSSTEVNPIHTFEEAGIYEVCLTVSNQYDNDTKCRIVELGTTSTTFVDKMPLKYKIYPNPAQNYFMIAFSEPILPSINLVHIYNVHGQLMKIVEIELINQQATISTEDLPSGTYFLKAIDQDGQINFVERLMIMK